MKMCACKHVKLGIYVEGLVWEVKLCSNGYSFYIPFSCYLVFSVVLTLTQEKKKSSGVCGYFLRLPKTRERCQDIVCGVHVCVGASPSLKGRSPD